MATSQSQLIKAITATIDHAKEVTASMEKLDKDTLYAGINELKNLIAEDPQLEKIFGDDLKTLRNNARFISSNSGIVKNAKNVAQAGDAVIGSAKRFMSSSAK